ncbi:MAG: sensor histidine kinase [Elusimicrobiota bacterium]
MTSSEAPQEKEARSTLAGGTVGKVLRYQHLWLTSVIVTSLVAITPLLIMAAFDYSHNRAAGRVESQLTINRLLGTTKRSLEDAIRERREVLSLLLIERSHSELTQKAALSRTLAHLQDTFGGFVDLGLIDSGGKQIAYAGPFDLKGKNYKDQDWFHATRLKGVYVSDVFKGFRNFPHFVIALQKKKGADDFFILRATLDMELINRRIYDLNLDRDTDAFIINQDGVLQTDSALYGAALTRIDIRVPSRSRSTDVVDERLQDGSWLTSGFAYIEDAPYIFVVVKRQRNPLWVWLGHRSTMFWFLGASIIVILAVGFFSSTWIVKRLGKADAERARELHDLEYTNKLATIGRMAATVAHEINNPLAIIEENAGLLKDMATFSAGHPQKEKTLKLVELIHKSVARCSDVTHRLLGFAKRMDIQREPIALDKLLEEVASFQKTEALHRNIKIDFALPDSLPPVIGDRGKLQQVFLNIISNALSAVDDGGRIQIEVAQLDATHASVMVTDNGSGIGQKDLKHIFEPFYSTKGEFGTGLGLSITRDIVTKLGGTIEVQSEVGSGTSFIVTLPIQGKV